MSPKSQSRWFAVLLASCSAPRSFAQRAGPPPGHQGVMGASEEVSGRSHSCLWGAAASSPPPLWVSYSPAAEQMKGQGQLGPGETQRRCVP